MPASEQDVAVQVAEMRGDMRAMRDLFELHTTQDMEQFTGLVDSIHDIDGKVDQLLLREAHRAGEHSGIKRSVIVMSFFIATAVSGFAAVVQAFVG